jgi:branched-chain amino acid transport system substrate-binding protein
MKRLKRGLLISSVVLLVALFATDGTVSAANPKGDVKVLKIGAIVTVTGPAAAGLKDMADAAGPAEEYFNSKGGITVAGQKYNIKIIAEDDQSNPQGALAAANKLISRDGVKFILAPIIPQNNIAISPLCEKAKVIHVRFHGVGGKEEINPDLRYSFASYMNLYNAPFTYDYLVKNYPQVKRVAIVPVDDPGGVIGSEFGEKAAKAHGLQVVAKQFYPFDAQDFNPILTKVLDKKPDAIDISVGIVVWGSGIINAARELGFKGPIFAPTPLGDMDVLAGMIKGGAQAANDIFITSPDMHSPKMTPMIREIVPLIEKRLNTRARMDHTIPFETLVLLLAAIEKAQSLDTEKVVQTWENMKEINTIFGKGRMGGKDLFGINHVVIRPVPMSRIVNGKVEHVGFFEKKD